MTKQNSDNSFDILFELDSIKGLLPANYLAAIQKRLEEKVSTRQITYVLNNERTDHYGIIDTALDIAFEEKKRRESIAKRQQRLKK